jgi:primosomal protein N'
MEIVNCIASGYEFVCPHCDSLNGIIGWNELAQCHDCKEIVTLDHPTDAYENLLVYGMIID